jgi:diphthamide biosynthesis protein 2
MPSVQESAFSASGQETLRYPIETDSHEFVPQLPPFDLSSVESDPIVFDQWNHQYELKKILNWVTSNGFKKVALQFPDALLPHSIQVSQWLSNHSSDVQFFVLADTTFGSCCVDEIAAEHALCESLVHFGRSCMSPNKRLPVLYVFPKKTDLDVSDCVLSISKELKKEDTITLKYEVFYHPNMGKLFLLFTSFR